MARTLLDLNDDLLKEAMALSGAGTKVATVTVALQELVRRRRAEQFGHRLLTGTAADLDDPEVISAAQR